MKLLMAIIYPILNTFAIIAAYAQSEFCLLFAALGTITYIMQEASEIKDKQGGTK